MPITSVAALLEALRQTQLLEPAQLEEIALPAQLRLNEPPLPLTEELVQRGWLTPYQKERLLEGRGGELVLGQYVLLDRLGVGGMGHVFKARHRRLSRIDAVKIIRPEHLANPEAVGRFLREARAAARLSHPNIVLIYDASEVHGTHYLAMEYVDGIDLGRLLDERGKLPVYQACDYIHQAALGLQHAHERGLVHRDVKPANLLLTARGERIKVLDLGLARVLDTADAEDSEGGTDVLTRPGMTMGSWDYLAPEQANDAHAVDIRADVYGLGCTFYHLLIGRAPFDQAQPAEKLVCHQLYDPEPVEKLRPDLPHGLGAVVQKMLAKAPADRYQTPEAVAKALLPYLQEEVSTPDVPVNVSEILNKLPPVNEDEGEQDEEPTTAGVTGLWQGFGRTLDRHRTMASVLGSALLLGAVLLFGGALWLAFGMSGKHVTETKPSDDSAPNELTKGSPKVLDPLAGLPKTFKNSLGMEFVLIPPGQFKMGSPPTEPGRNEDDEHEHDVVLTKPFYLAVKKVTQEQYSKFLGAEVNPSLFRAGQDKRIQEGEDTSQFPVEQVTFAAAETFCGELSRNPEEAAAGRVYRLPTEAEWEYACRAGKRTAYSFGDDPTQLKEHAWYAANSENRPHPVGHWPPNAWGLFDMHGDIAEWCQDWYARFFYLRSLKDPCNQTPGDPLFRVVRGGSFQSKPEGCRSAGRGGLAPGSVSETVGFRLACEIRPPAGKAP